MRPCGSCASFGPDILLLDLRMPGKDGLTVLREMTREKLPTRAVVLTAVDGEDVLEAVNLGVRGLVLKDMAPKLLVQCIREVHAGGQWLDRDSATHAVNKLLTRETSMQSFFSHADAPRARSRVHDCKRDAQQGGRRQAVDHRGYGQAPLASRLPEAQRGRAHGTDALPAESRSRLSSTGVPRRIAADSRPESASRPNSRVDVRSGRGNFASGQSRIARGSTSPWGSCLRSPGSPGPTLPMPRSPARSFHHPASLVAFL